MPDSLGLGVHAAAGHPGYQLELVAGVGHPERLVDDDLPRSPVEILVHQLAVDQHRPAIGTGVEAYPRDSPLAFSGTVKILLLCFRLHQSSYLSLISFVLLCQLTYLGLVGVVAAGIHLEPLQHFPAQLVAGQHPLDCQLKHPVRVRFQHISQDK